MRFKLAALLVVMLAVAGTASGAARTHKVHKLCVYFEVNGSAVTRSDVKVAPNGLKVRKVCIVGKRGPRGKAGAKGKAGAAGQAGAKGAAGAQGKTGQAGATGPAGTAGPTGPAGPAGQNGENGQAGATGPAGQTGATGAAGATGPQGPAGEGANVGDVYACVSNGNNAKIVDDPSECDPGHDAVYRLDGVKLP